MISQFGVVPVDQVAESTDNPRTQMDPRALDELAESIHEQGILVPLLVRRATDNGHYVIVDGARRYKAARAIGLDVVPIAIQEDDDASSLAQALVANLQRADVHPLDEARGFRTLLAGEIGPDALPAVGVLARQIGKHPAYVWNLSLIHI